jgi:hypothetical protein
MVAQLQSWFVHADGPEFGLALGTLLFAAAAGLHGFLRFSRLLRLIADTPTARVRSAPQGFVELQGTTGWLPGPEIHARLTGYPCVWYRYTIEEYRGNGRNRRRTVIERGQSDDLFELRDGTGSCVIDPDGATVIRPDRDIWTGANLGSDFGPKVNSGWFSRGRFRYTEERLHAQQALLVLGEFRTRHHLGQDREERMKDLLARWKNDPEIIRRFDSSGDGRLSLDDWDRVRAAARTEVERQMATEEQPDAFHLVRRGDHGTQRILLLSTLSEAQLLLRQRIRAYGSGLAFIIAASLALWAITLRY